MSIKQLLDPILDQGIRHTHFFEGRLLTGEDLRNQQQANRQHDRRTGKAIGAGIIQGLEVKLEQDGSDGTSPQVRVSKGLAINGEGEIVGLPTTDIKLTLSRTIGTVEVEQADFYLCSGPPGNQHIPNGVGIYLLLMSPAAAYKERAPKSGLGDEGVVKGCGSRYIQEGVQFRTVQVTTEMLISMPGVTEVTRDILKTDLLDPANPIGTDASDLPRLSRLRNMLAHLCFASERVDAYSLGPFEQTNGLSPLASYGVIDELFKQNEINDCDIPLALMYWTLNGIAFVDNWSVRRQLTGCFNAKGQSSYEAGLRDVMVAKATVSQFQQQLDDLIDTLPDPSVITAHNYFHFLPSLGVLPLAEDVGLPGLNYQTFLGDLLQKEPVHIDAAHLFGLVQESYDYPVIPIASKELIWLYLIRQNRLDIDNGVTGVQTHLVFTNGHMLFRGHARFNLARWDYSNYSSIVD